MIELEIIGSEDAVASAKDDIAPHAETAVRQFSQKGFAGEAALIGIVTSVATTALPEIFVTLRSMVLSGRNLRIKVRGLELTARDIAEASDVIDLLHSRGLLHKE
jgi:hypothetical protein